MSEIPQRERTFSRRIVLKKAAEAAAVVAIASQLPEIMNPKAAEAYTAPVLGNKNHEVSLQAAEPFVYPDPSVHQYPWKSANWFPQKRTAGQVLIYEQNGPLDKFDQLVRNQGKPSEARSESERFAKCETGLSASSICEVEGDSTRNDLGRCRDREAAGILFPEPSNEIIKINGVNIDRITREAILTEIGVYQGIIPLIGEDLEITLDEYDIRARYFLANIPNGMGPGVWFRTILGYDKRRGLVKVSKLGDEPVNLPVDSLRAAGARVHVPILNLRSESYSTLVHESPTAYRSNEWIRRYEDFALRVVYFKPQ